MSRFTLYVSSSDADRLSTAIRNGTEETGIALTVTDGDRSAQFTIDVTSDSGVPMMVVQVGEDTHRFPVDGAGNSFNIIITDDPV